MKSKKKWLLIFVLILLLINIFFYVAMRLTQVDAFVYDKLTDYLAETLDAEVSMESFSFNDRQVNISGLDIQHKEDDYTVTVDNMFIEYDFFELVLRRLHSFRAIKKITIETPKITYHYHQTDTDAGAREDITIPDIGEYFKELSLQNGTIEFFFNGSDFSFSSKWEDVNTKIINDETSNIVLSARDERQATLQVSSEIDNGNIEYANIELKNFMSDYISTDIWDEHSAVINLSAEYRHGQFIYDVGLKDLAITKDKYIVLADSLHLGGVNENLFITPFNLLVDGNHVSGEIFLSDILAEHPGLEGTLKVETKELGSYLDLVDNGLINADIKLNGTINSPKAELTIESESITVHDQTLESILVKAYYDKDFSITDISLIWQGNSVKGDGIYSLRDGLSLDLQSPDFNYQTQAIDIAGDLSASISYMENDLGLSLRFNRAVFEHPIFSLSNVNTTLEVQNEDYVLNIDRPQRDLVISSQGNLSEETHRTSINLRRFSLPSVLPNVTLPDVTANIELEYKERVFSGESVVRVYDQDFGKLDGRFDSSFFLNFAEQTSFFELKSHNARYNYEPFFFALNASGDLDSLHIDHFVFEDIIFAKGWITHEPKFNYGFEIWGSDVRLVDVLKYGVNYYTAQSVAGRFDLSASYDSRLHGTANANLHVRGIEIGELKPFSAVIEVSGIDERIDIEKFSVTNEGGELFSVDGWFNIMPEFTAHARLNIDRVDLSSIFNHNYLAGQFNLSSDISIQPNKMEVITSAYGSDIRVDKLKMGNLALQASQRGDLFTIDSLKVDNDIYTANAVGELGYNIFTGETSTVDSSVIFHAEGNILRWASDFIPFIRDANSDGRIDLEFGVDENGLSFKEGIIKINDGGLLISSQRERVEQINTLISIENNEMNIDNFTAKMGDGTIFITNEITNSEEDFLLSRLRMGRLLARTNHFGILIHIPRYMPPNSIARVVAGGRNGADMIISGPFDDLSVQGELQVYNSELIFPPGTENILKVINVITIERRIRRTEPTFYNFDLYMIFEDNNRYVTYPTNLRIQPGSYLHLKHENDRWFVQEASFISEEGSVNMFGTQLNTDFFQVTMNYLEPGVKISGEFYRQAHDGTLITMQVYTTEEENGTPGTELQFSLISDNPADRDIDILSLLRYGRRVDELSDSQRKTLLQDEFVQLAGLGIQSAFLDPLISPVENWIRQSFKLDYFYLHMDVIQNIVAQYYPEGTEHIYEEHQYTQTEFGPHTFLNNLTMRMGKYIMRDLFIDYEAQFQKPREIAIREDLGVFHNIAIRYNLPYRFRLSYHFKVMPFSEPNTHEIMLERSFRFW